MVSSALTMTYAEKQARAAFKRKTLMAFLVSGEQWTTLSVTADLLQTTERNALRLLQTLVKEKLIKVDEGIVEHSNLKLYGISAHGIAVTESSNPGCREFPVGRTNPGYVQHHIQGQIIRIRAERAGWTNWVPGKLLMVENDKRLKKLPDALVTRGGRRVAVELERYVKSQKRLADVVGLHLQQIVAKHYDYVYYFVPSVAAQARAFAKVEFVIVDGNKIKLNETHRARFKVYNLKDWRGEA